METKVILYDSPEAAQLKTLTLWVDKDNRPWATEDMARYSSHTHKKCDCGELMSRGWTKCDMCRNTSALERYYKLPVEPWTNQSGVYSDVLDKYFFSPDEIDEYMADNEIDVNTELQLVFVDPNHYNQIDDDYWCDIMPEDGDGELPKALADKLFELNELIKTLPPCSYSPGKIRTEYKPTTI